MSAAAIVSKAKATGIKLDERYVYSVRSTMNTARRKTTTKSPAPSPRATGNGSERGGSLEAEIERIVEAKVNVLLRERLGALFGR